MHNMFNQKKKKHQKKNFRERDEKPKTTQDIHSQKKKNEQVHML